MKKSRVSAGVDPICDFYTSHPYPPPLENLDRARDLWQDDNVHRAEWHLFFPHRQYHPDFAVLVAGCGTWQAAKFAFTHPQAHVVGIDVSTASLDHTEALRKKHDLTNLEVRQLAIESVGELDRQFDLIVCTGVLHHLVDPDAGLRALRSVLKPEGAMYLMVYAPYGRAGVHLLQEYCRRLGVGPSAEEIGDLTQVLRGLPPQHPLIAMFRGARETLDADALVDALLNPRDRAYSVAEVFEFVESNDLQFGRWCWQAPYSPRCGPIAESPHASRLLALPERDQFIEMELWRGLITNHDFIVYPRGRKRPFAVDFRGDRLPAYIPIRRPWTTCIEERLPPEAAGALLNQAHLFNDLFILIDEREKRIYDAIDGRRSVAEILAGDKLTGSVRDFFEKLWWHDQVVFETTGAK